MLRVHNGLRKSEWQTGRDPAELSLPVDPKRMGVESFLRRCLALDPEERLAMSVEDGLRYIVGFRDWRKQLAAETKIDEEVWFDAEEEESEDEYEGSEDDAEGEDKSEAHTRLEIRDGAE